MQWFVVSRSVAQHGDKSSICKCNENIFSLKSLSNCGKQANNDPNVDILIDNIDQNDHFR